MEIISSILAGISPLITDVVLTTSGASLIILLLTKWIPNDKLTLWFNGFGRVISSFGRSKFGIIFWEKIEDFLEDSVYVCGRAFLKGLEEDDNSPLPPPGGQGIPPGTNK
jgi:hypothetical protein